MAVTCPKCQFENPSDTHYCSNCGTPLNVEESLPASLTKTLVTPPPIISKDTLIAGKYRILDEIGRGGMGIVYKAEDIRLKRTVALKFLPPHLADFADLKKRFLVEAQAAASLSHPNICVIHEIGEAEDRPFIAMEYVDGETLRDKIRKKALTTEEALAISIQVAALRAIELDENLAGAHETLAMVRWLIDWDWDGAWAAWRRAIELNPNVGTAQAMYAHFLLIMGHGEEALAHSKRSVELDPFNSLFHAWYSQVLYMQRRYDEAISAAREAQHPIATGTLWYVYDEKGMEKEAFEAAKACAKVMYNDPRIEAALDEGYAQGGYAEAMKRGAEALIARIPETFPLPSDTAIFYALAGEKDKAIEWLEKGSEAHDPFMPYIGVSPFFDDLHPDPRFQDLLRKMRLPAGDKKREGG